MYMFMSKPLDAPIQRVCPIRLFLPTVSNNSPTPEWSDVGFAYLRELHRFAEANPGVLPNVQCLAAGMAMVDFSPSSIWAPYAKWFLGRCPEPSHPLALKPSLVNVVIGAGESIDTYYTPGCVNILVTGHGIPPHKINWLSETAWKYDSIITMSPKHSQVIDNLREKAKDLAKQRLCIATDQELVPDPFDRWLADEPLKMTIVVPPNAANIGQLVATLKTALEKCVPESERSYG
jgi:hypothetical protein